MKLYANEVSSATSRVKIALALKGLAVEIEPVTIFGEAAESRQARYRAINPQGLVPALQTDTGELITQSLAIIEYLDERYRTPPLLPADPEDRAFARAIALSIAAEIHALLPPRVAARLSTIPGMDAEGVAAWARHWVDVGFCAIEERLAARRTGRFVVGDVPTVADIYLFPQAIGAGRMGFDVAQRWPHIAAIVAALHDVPAFALNAPAPRT
ncbi:maleylacetoacetate isomerase [Cupriavidus sp. SZY C1]|uniref:maleylacetoacetate isomerase n=1 Tax=Cupriavidus sp. SZY C1 TaxID=3055037 RepID=UPI0028B82981|nr:maleylacetoacetate isomerase [Cupriavidus sp. SZY C1]MDT6964641.1 maleylacetoacetate isomerase [Cupriavidus sp. SZY C1]